MKKLSKTFKERNFDNGKANSQMLHFIRRFDQRVGIKLTENDYEHIVSSIKNEKKCNLCEIEYLYNQSQRLKVFQLTFGDSSVNAIYDCKRKSIVTILFQGEGIDITTYYNIFNTRVNLKHDLGYNIGWKILGDEIFIPNETIEYHDGYCEVVSDGILKGKKFRIDNLELHEVM